MHNNCYFWIPSILQQSQLTKLLVLSRRAKNHKRKEFINKLTDVIIKRRSVRKYTHFTINNFENK